MCGIFASLCQNESNLELTSSCLSAIRRRGPDSENTLHLKYPSLHDKTSSGNGSWYLQLSASVLHLRGNKVQPQPLESEHGILLWNGEIFDGILVEPHENDTLVLSQKIESECWSPEHTFDHIKFQYIVSLIKGPFAFLYYQKNGVLWFGRDRIGRRSLLWHLPTFENNVFYMCSTFVHPHSSIRVSEPVFWEEVKTDGFYRLSLSDISSVTELRSSIEHFPWNKNNLLISIPPKHENVVEDCFHRLVSAVARRLYTIDSMFISIHNDSLVLKPTKVAILYSGGLDSSLLVAIVDRLLPKDQPIDLLNIAFQNTRSSTSASCSSYELAPDRITGRAGLLELSRLSPERDWRFVEINVSHTEYQEARSCIIERMLPNDTIMDLSIAAPFWFCGRAKGTLLLNGDSSSETHLDYESAAKVLLVGFGADELFGGYARYRSKYERFGESGLREEMALDVQRMWQRNLGRDDRCLSDHGREPRYPFLDEEFMEWVETLPLTIKSDFSLPRGQGEKSLLRQVARDLLGLHLAASLPKRAIQFGAKSAKMDQFQVKARGLDKLSFETYLNK